jgi:hypothetical protein
VAWKRGATKGAGGGLGGDRRFLYCRIGRRKEGGSDVDRHCVEDGKGDLAWLAPELGGGATPARVQQRQMACVVMLRGEETGEGKGTDRWA